MVTRFAITSRWQRKQQLLQLLFLAEGHIMMINLLNVLNSQLSLSIKLFPCMYRLSLFASVEEMAKLVGETILLCTNVFFPL